MSAGGTSRIQLVLQGRQQVAAGLSSVGTQIGHLAQQTQRYNIASAEAHKRTFLMNQAMFTMRRFAYAGTLAMGALGTAAVATGIKFNISMEQNQIAMGHFLGSQQRATRELEYLFELAARTPFEFQNVVEAERRFLAFGYSLQEARNALVTIGDVAAGLGGDPATNIERLVLVLGQVRATGRVLGQDMLQLQQLGINTNKIFREELGLTRQDLMQGVGELQIPSEIAIPALLRGMRKQFQGMAEEQAQTLGGMLSTLRDYRNQFLGAMTEPITDHLRTSVVPGLIELTREMTIAAKAGASFTEVIAIMDSRLGAHGAILTTWIIIRNIFTVIGNLFRNVVIPAFRIAYALTWPLWMGLRFLSDILVPLSEHTYIFGLMLGYLAARFVYATTFGTLMSIWTIRQTILWRIAIFTGMRFGWMLRFVGRSAIFAVVQLRALWLWTSIYRFAIMVATTSLILHTKAWFAWQLTMLRARLALIGATASTWLFNIALYANPIMMVVAALVILVGGLVLLERKYGAVTKIINYLWDRMRRFNSWLNNSRVGRLLSFGVGNAINSIPILGPSIQAIRGAFATGGTAMTSGRYLVGERGPEVVHLPSRSRVVPIGQAQFAGADGAGWPEYIELHSHIEVDGRELAEVTSKYRLSRAARK